MNRIERYNNIARKSENKSLEVIEKLRVKENHRILEIGVGGGYYANLFSNLIGENGLYYGADTENEFLKNLEEINQNGKYKNIRTLKIDETDFPKPDKKVNIIFTRNVYHHLSDRTEYFKRLGDFLEDDGIVAIIDYDESLSLMRLFGHYTKSKIIISEMEKANYVLKTEYKILKKQSFFIFTRQ